MNALFEKLETLVSSPTLNVTNSIGDMRRLLSGCNGIDRARGQGIMRLCLALQEIQSAPKPSLDVTVLIRQVILSYQRRLRIHRNIWLIVSQYEESVGLYVAEADETIITVDANRWQPKWLPTTAFTPIEALAVRRLSELVIGDGLLYAMSAITDHPYTTYQSMAQKMAVEISLFAKPGSTTLITLPTGNGKSLCALLPAWLDSNGGQKAGGTTLVIVPTTALAEDQVQHAHHYFKDSHNAEYKPHHWISSTSADERSTIRYGLENGTLPILYTSPEALVSYGLGAICLDAARKGYIRRIVVDEAHLVEYWGAQFRVEFQLLSAYRQRLLEATEGQLITLLLSATVTDTCKALLSQLFSPEQPMASICANRLRPELTTWFSHAHNWQNKQKRILEGLSHLPRPIILYTTLVEDAESWARVLHKEGFRRVACYTGKTSVADRTNILHQWAENKLDIIVATSAFGVGVDKADLRTVIHSALPENLDRFYQEIGRGGRDGNSAISLLCVTSKDIDISESMSVVKRIKPDKGWSRWHSMWQAAQSIDNDLWAVEINAPPLYNPEIGEGERNQDWNAHTLLIMMRASLIEVLDTHLDATTRAKPNYQNAVSNPQWWKIRLLEPDKINDEEMFSLMFEAVRQHDFEYSSNQYDRMNTLLTMYRDDATQPPETCIAHHFAEVYPHTGLACGGCAYCRQTQESPYCEPMHFTLDVTLQVATMPPIRSTILRRQLGTRGILNVFYDPSLPAVRLKQTLLELLPILLGAGIQQFILPDQWINEVDWSSKLLERFGNRKPQAHRILMTSWLSEIREYPLFVLPSVIVFPPDAHLADRMYRELNRYRPLIKPILHVVSRDLVLNSLHGRFLDRVNGQPEHLDQLRDMLRDEQDSVAF